MRSRRSIQMGSKQAYNQEQIYPIRASKVLVAIAIVTAVTVRYQSSFYAATQERVMRWPIYEYLKDRSLFIFDAT